MLDHIRIDGDPGAHACTATFTRADRRPPVATIGRDRENLQAELDLERTRA